MLPQLLFAAFLSAVAVGTAKADTLGGFKVYLDGQQQGDCWVPVDATMGTIGTWYGYSNYEANNFIVSGDGDNTNDLS